MRRIGLIVNPIAGMGGSVGLKGTDGEAYERALKLGAKPVTPRRTRDFLYFLRDKDEILFLVAPGKMGEEYVEGSGVKYRVVGDVGDETSSEDTKRIATEMLNEGIELLVFVGGDGTARDIYDVVDSSIPVIGIPSGVKMFSPVFATSAKAAALLLDAFLEGVGTREEDVLDIDEEAFRAGKLAARLYGSMLVPDSRTLLQGAKEASNVTASVEEEKERIADYVAERVEGGVLYLLGPGTTLRSITRRLGVEKTLLGVDAVVDGELVGADLNERGILDLLDRFGRAKIIVTPIGGNGFIFGRGSKQFTPTVLRRVGRENVIVVGTRDKIDGLDYLRVDTGDLDVDSLLCGHMNVIVGYREEVVMEVKC